MIYYKFIKWEPVPIENVLQEKLPAALAEYDNGNKKPFNDLQIATTDPYFRRGGWCFPIHQYLKRYWVKTRYSGILEYFAVNKTAIRKELESQIIEIKEM